MNILVDIQLIMSLSTYSHQPCTSIYHKDPLNNETEDARQLLVMIPGNPGLADFYITYLNLIQKQFPNFELLAISHAGFGSTSDEKIDDDKDFAFYNLEFQINHKVKIITDFVLRQERMTEIYFLSHSVGSYVTQRVVRALLDDEELDNKMKIKFLGLICPTIIDIGKSNSGKALTKLLTYLPIIQIAVYLVGLVNILLPDKLVKSIIENSIITKPSTTDKEAAQSYENSVSGAMKLYKKKDMIKQALTLAEEEMNTIVQDNELNDWFFIDLPTNNNIKIWSFFAFDDHWVHDTTRDYILTRYHDVDNANLKFQAEQREDGKGITHSFCVHQSVEFSEITCKVFQELVS